MEVRTTDQLREATVRRAIDPTAETVSEAAEIDEELRLVRARRAVNPARENLRIVKR